MVKHISIFYLKAENKEDNEALLLKYLAQMESKLEHICGYVSGKDCMQRPPKGITGLPMFGDAVQVIDFENRDSADDYPNHPAHRELMEKAGAMIENVAAIDIEY